MIMRLINITIASTFPYLILLRERIEATDCDAEETFREFVVIQSDGRHYED